MNTKLCVDTKFVINLLSKRIKYLLQPSIDQRILLYINQLLYSGVLNPTLKPKIITRGQDINNKISVPVCGRIKGPDYMVTINKLPGRLMVCIPHIKNYLACTNMHHIATNYLSTFRWTIQTLLALVGYLCYYTSTSIKVNNNDVLLLVGFCYNILNVQVGFNWLLSDGRFL